MTVVADAGPLIALAKVSGLDVLFRLFPKVLTPPAVYGEVVSMGLRLQAADAADLDLCYRQRKLEVVAPKKPAVVLGSRLGRGEEESIRLAIEHQADWLLVDDLDARRAALAAFQSAGSTTRTKGTLGLILTSHHEGHLPREQAIGMVEALSRRLDVWVSSDLCQRVLEILKRAPE